MLLQLHIKDTDSIQNKVDIEWLRHTGFDVKDNWLDCTHYIKDFNKEDVPSFCFLMCEITSVDLVFDKWRLLS